MHWPRMMKRQTAAQYCDMSVAAFEREIAILKFRAPIFKGLTHIGGKHESKDRNGLPFAGKHTPGGPNND